MDEQPDPQPKVTTVFKALMHPARVAILEVLRGDEHCVCHLEAVLGLRQAYISQQLVVLKQAGLVTNKRDGLNIFYRVVHPSTFTLLDIARVMTGTAIAPPVKPNAAVFCPCPKCNIAVLETSLVERKW